MRANVNRSEHRDSDDSNFSKVPLKHFTEMRAA